MSTIQLEKERCKACGYCVFSCPTEALEISENLNKNGYAYVVHDEEKCIKCGICYTVCPDNVFQFLDK